MKKKILKGFTKCDYSVAKLITEIILLVFFILVQS